MNRLESALRQQLHDERAYSAICERTIFEDNRGASRLWVLVLAVLLVAFWLAWLRFQIHAGDNFRPMELK